MGRMKELLMREDEKEVANEKKLRCRNFPTHLLKGLFEVAQMGEDKYGTYDYLEGTLTVSDHLDALKRHLMTFEDPSESDYDQESYQLHLYHMAWRALVAAYVMENKPLDLDDRWKGNK